MSKPAPSSCTKKARPPSCAIEPIMIVFEQGLAEAVETAERRPQVVRHRIGKGLELLVGRLELRGVAPQPLFSLFAARDVADDGREGDLGSLVPGRKR